MNKSKIILASLGGVIAAASLALAYLIWDAVSEKGEHVDELDSAFVAADRLVRLPVFPGAAGVEAYKANAGAYEKWRESAEAIVSSGDMVFEATTPPAFKAFLQDEARRLSALPGGVDGKIVKSDFPFGFNDYINGGVLPAQADLSRLQREWHDVASVVEALSGCGIIEIVSVAVAQPKPVEKDGPAAARRNRNRAAAARQAKLEADEDSGPAVTSFTVEFLTRPSGLVNAVNALLTARRFVVVNDFSFSRVKDDLADILDSDGKKDEPVQRTGRRRRAAQQVEAPKPDEDSAKKDALVTDPLSASPLKVTMSVSVYDFRSLESASGENGGAKEDK